MALEKIKSERTLKALKPGAGRINDGGGLYLVPFAWGESHYWRMDYTHQGRRRTMSLGVYPEIGLEDVRTNQQSKRLQHVYGQPRSPLSFFWLPASRSRGVRSGRTSRAAYAYKEGRERDGKGLRAYVSLGARAGQQSKRCKAHYMSLKIN